MAAGIVTVRTTFYFPVMTAEITAKRVLKMGGYFYCTRRAAES
jgi:hypothetical protein